MLQHWSGNPTLQCSPLEASNLPNLDTMKPTLSGPDAMLFRREAAQMAREPGAPTVALESNEPWKRAIRGIERA